MNQMHLKSTINTQKRCGGRCFGDYIANFDLTHHIKHFCGQILFQSQNNIDDTRATFMTADLVSFFLFQLVFDHKVNWQ